MLHVQHMFAKHCIKISSISTLQWILYSTAGNVPECKLQFHTGKLSGDLLALTDLSPCGTMSSNLIFFLKKSSFKVPIFWPRFSCVFKMNKSEALFHPTMGKFTVCLCNPHRLPPEAPLRIFGFSGGSNQSPLDVRQTCYPLHKGKCFHDFLFRYWSELFANLALLSKTTAN